MIKLEDNKSRAGIGNSSGVSNECGLFQNGGFIHTVEYQEVAAIVEDDEEEYLGNFVIPGGICNNWVIVDVPTVIHKSTLIKPIEHNDPTPSPNFEFPVFEAEEDDDEEIPYEITRLLEHEEKIIQPHLENLEIVNLGSEDCIRFVKDMRSFMRGGSSHGFIELVKARVSFWSHFIRRLRLKFICAWPSQQKSTKVNCAFNHGFEGGKWLEILHSCSNKSHLTFQTSTLKKIKSGQNFPKIARVSVPSSLSFPGLWLGESFSPVKGNYVALILIPDEARVPDSLVTCLLGSFSCVLGDGCKTSDWHSVSYCRVLGVRYKSSNWHLVSSVGLFGSESDVSPAIGIRFPCLPILPVFCLACVSRTTVALILIPDEIRRHRMRYPSEPVHLFFHLCCFRGANTFPLHNRLPIPSLFGPETMSFPGFPGLVQRVLWLSVQRISGDDSDVSFSSVYFGTQVRFVIVQYRRWL
ncbi:hypothetical protein KIW84_013240 [Lathyrus oleraceus]|uniref:Uncharacterized protein n=1 Tax=Pisum sativum TaxID=3888 RepID=A0A9D5GXF6_PEA|nr:hypothetical protein KIW84_013240 [Pisum sativum]